MSDFELSAGFAFDRSRPLEEKWNGFEISELPRRPTFWVSVARDDEPALGKACAKLLGTPLPLAGTFITSGDEDEVLLAWTGARQWLVRAADWKDIAPIAKIANLTDLTDGWVGLRVRGEKARDILATLCPLDLEPSSFGDGSCARSLLEGLHCLIVARNSENGAFDLFFQRSSARSFADNLRHGAYSYCGDRIPDGN